MSREPTRAVIKMLFALSGNTCAYRSCEQRLYEPGWLSVQAEAAHICGERPGSARYDPDMSDHDRDSFDNRILLCPNCHNRIDQLDPVAHPVSLLQEMKEQHEGRSLVAGGGKPWTTDDVLDRCVALLVVRTRVLYGDSPFGFAGRAEGTVTYRDVENHVTTSDSADPVTYADIEDHVAMSDSGAGGTGGSGGVATDSVRTVSDRAGGTDSASR